MSRQRGLILDLDRTLVRTGAIDELLTYTFEDISGMPGSSLRSMRASIEADGGTYDSVRGMRGLIDETVVQQVLTEFINRASQQRTALFEPGAERFIERLGDGGWSILTYGGADWQQAKLAACGLSEVPSIITQTTDKGQAIAAMRRDDVYVLPDGMKASSVVLVDDKAVSFLHLPDDGSLRGLWYWPSDRELIPSQQLPASGLPKHVERVESWDDVAEWLKENGYEM